MSTNTISKLLYGELSYTLNGILFAVHNELGRFAREKQYSDLMEKKLQENKIAYARECAIGDSGNIVDYIIEDSVIVELKAKPFLLHIDYDQTQRYLHVCDLQLAILVNFRSRYLQPKRVLRQNL